MTPEREIKLRIPHRTDYVRLRDGLPGATEVELQENHYIDTRGLALAKRLVMLRLRICRPAPGAPPGGSAPPAVLTFKRGTEIRAGFFQSVEDEARLSAEEARGILEAPGSILRLDCPPAELLRQAFGEPDLVLIGTLGNERRRYRLEGGLEVDLDRMRFRDGSEEYELEVETSDPVRAGGILRGALARLGVTTVPQTETKFERFLARLGDRPGATFTPGDRAL